MRRECSTPVLCYKDFCIQVSMRERIGGECVIWVITWAKMLPASLRDMYSACFRAIAPFASLPCVLRWRGWCPLWCCCRLYSL